MNDNPQLPPKKSLQERPSRARYDKAHHELERKWRRRELKAERMMREIVDVLWDQFAGAPYSWCGFYTLREDGQALILGPHRDRPACSPLPLHGVCGQVAQSGRPMNVADVKALGEAYVECHPGTASELALPVFDHKGKVIAVFDVDSEQPAAFDEMDQRWLERILKHFQDVGRPQ